MSIISFLDDYLSKYQWIFTRLVEFIDIVEILCRIANRYISLNFELSPHDMIIEGYYCFVISFSFSKHFHIPCLFQKRLCK